MSRPRLTLLGSIEHRLRQFLEGDPDGHERAAAVLLRRFHYEVEDLSVSDRYVAVDVIPFQSDWITGSSGVHVAFNLEPLREIFRRCEDEGLVFGFAHNHPAGCTEFSTTDNHNELTLLEAVSNRNGRDVHFVALLLEAGKWKARVRCARNPETVVDARHVAVLGDRLQLHGYATEVEDAEFGSRQAAAFGAPFVSAIKSLRVAVIGASGTGSPTIELLARAGVGEILIFEKDPLSKSNLNRVRGARMADVSKNKGLVLRDYVNSLGLPCRATCIELYVDEDGEGVDALSTCDVVFGCTDDQLGRECVNAALYVYAMAYIDLGLGGNIEESPDGHACLRRHHGRVSVVLPELGQCLFCQGVITAKWIGFQVALRANPDMTEEEAKERYLENGGEASPGVGPFTSAVADFGVSTLFDLVRPYRRLNSALRRDQFLIDFVSMEIRSVEQDDNPECVYCGTRDYLLLGSLTRLKRPALGRRPIYV